MKGVQFVIAQRISEFCKPQYWNHFYLYLHPCRCLLLLQLMTLVLYLLRSLFQRMVL